VASYFRLFLNTKINCSLQYKNANNIKINYFYRNIGTFIKNIIYKIQINYSKRNVNYNIIKDIYKIKIEITNSPSISYKII
jgi:hypothetical protein